MKYIMLFVLTVFLAVQCKPDHGDTAVEVLYDEVILIHDEVMPKISDISKLKRRVQKLDTKNEDALTIIKELEDADEAMMSWMADFQEYKTLADSSKSKKLNYLADEKVKIQKVSDQMLLSIYTAQKYLNE